MLLEKAVDRDLPPFLVKESSPAKFLDVNGSFVMRHLKAARVSSAL